MNYNEIKNALNLIENPVPFEPVIVEGVSSAYDDYLPLISPDGSLALFTKAYMKKEINSIYGDRFVEEFTVSKASTVSRERAKVIDWIPFFSSMPLIVRVIGIAPWRIPSCRFTTGGL